MKQYKEFHPIILTLALFFVALVIFFVVRFPNINLWMLIFLYAFIDIGFIVAFILGVKSKNRTVKVVSIFSNIACMIPTSIWLFLLLLANGISES
ncbi:hypothetical protein [Lysinibacillus piscis]|uniref:Uncharacterized protein n=1 Tax=Lysinibacillus piscis TaxID=2518931 RepID=A0ABQ5NJG1_9BACI|nr:hypothetical protein [Lysinibacillus sp. KH24]GLC88498.1 hypothetical protein LYSBPC_16250 [Lysinibacillus sp. KH24]